MKGITQQVPICISTTTFNKESQWTTLNCLKPARTVSSNLSFRKQRQLRRFSNTVSRPPRVPEYQTTRLQNRLLKIKIMTCTPLFLGHSICRAQCTKMLRQAAASIKSPSNGHTCGIYAFAITIVCPSDLRSCRSRAAESAWNQRSWGSKFANAMRHKPYVLLQQGSRPSKIPQIAEYICDKAHFDPNQKNSDETSSVSL